MLIDNVNVIIENGPFSMEDAQNYISMIQKKKKGFHLKKIAFSRSDAFLDIRYMFHEIPFERIRRISLAETQDKRAVNK